MATTTSEQSTSATISRKPGEPIEKDFKHDPEHRFKLSEVITCTDEEGLVEDQPIERVESVPSSKQKEQKRVSGQKKKGSEEAISLEKAFSNSADVEDAAQVRALIVAMREYADMTQEDLAEAMGRTQQTISAMERSGRPSTSTLRRVAAATNVRLAIQAEPSPD